MQLWAGHPRIGQEVRSGGPQAVPRVLIVTPWFPNAPGDREGNFIFSSTASLAHAGLPVAVLVVRPWLTFALSRMGHEAVSGRFDPAAFPDFRLVQLVHYLSIPRNRLPKLDAWLHDRTVGDALMSLASEFKATLIHAHTEGEAPIATAVGQKLNIPVVVTLHGINTAPRYFDLPFRRARFKLALSAADRVILVGKPLEKVFAEVVGRASNFRIVPNGFNPPAMAPCLPFAKEDKVRFISVSNLHEGKGIDVALMAMAKARSQGLENFTYTVIGDGSERETLVALAARLGLQDKVRFAGACAHDQVYTLLREADVFVLPSYREAFGIAYLEAMAAGLLAIGVEGEGPSVFIRDGETGFLVPPRDPDRLAACLIAVANNRDEMRAIAAAGRAYVTRNLTWDRHAQKLIDLYREVSRL